MFHATVIEESNNLSLHVIGWVLFGKEPKVELILDEFSPADEESRPIYAKIMGEA
jgi:hypothetical protein